MLRHICIIAVFLCGALGAHGQKKPVHKVPPKGFPKQEAPRYPDIVSTVKDVPPAQQCTVAIKDVPAIRGFKIGTPKAEILDRLPGLLPKQVDGEPKGIERAAYYPTEDRDFDGVRWVSLVFWDDKLQYIALFYKPELEWTSVKEYTQQISSALKLPPKAWGFGITEALEMGDISCADFRARAELNPIDGKYSFQIEDSTYQARAAKKEQDERDAKKRGFKP